MKSVFWLILPVFIIMAMIYSSFMLYKIIDPFPVKIPTDLSELADWPLDDLWSLYKNRLDCWELPDYSNKEEKIISDWRMTCNTARAYWNKAYDLDKQNKAVEIAEEIFK